jgi:hypothetical protein
MGAHAQRLAGATGTADAPCRPHLDRIVDAFFVGYRTAIDRPAVQTLVAELSRIDPEHRGFAFEGAGMAAAALDLLWPSRARRLAQLLGAAPGHRYLLHVGAGWALARLRCIEGRMFHQLDPVLRWLAVDGAGFHEGYFGEAPGRPRRHLRRRLSAAGARVFDQGLGRSLWFTAAADPPCIASAIARLGRDRHADLWSGVGIACAYAGGVDDEAIDALREASGPSRAHLAQGAAFAAEAHIRGSGQSPNHTERACRLLCGKGAVEAAALARSTARDLADEGDTSAYEVWRQRLRCALDPQVGARTE